MDLFGWLKKKSPEEKGWVRGMAVAIPHHPRMENLSNVKENSFSADSVSTMAITVRPLKPGETADAVGSQYPRIGPGFTRTTPTPEGCARLAVDCPNWIRFLARQEQSVVMPNAEIPVWIDPATGKAMAIDKDALIELYAPMRERGHYVWNNPGSVMPAAPASASTMIVTEEEVNTAPDMSQYPPIEGVSFAHWVGFSHSLMEERIPPDEAEAFLAREGLPAGRWSSIDAAWKDRVTSDWKMGALFGEMWEDLT